MTSLVLLSGGLDSAALLAGCVLEDSVGVSAVAFDYGQVSDRELEHAGMLADRYRVALDVVDLSSWGGLLGGSAVTDPTVDLPDGRWDDASQVALVLPGRLAALVSVAVAIADARAHSVVLAAVSAADAALHPDARPELVEALAATTRASTEGRVGFAAPFLGKTRFEVATFAVAHGVPLELTWSCHRDEDRHCGRCGGCSARHEALEAAVGDPTDYEIPPTA